MSTLPVQRQTRTLMADFAELLGGNPLLAGLRPLFDRNLLRVEDELTDGRYEVRAEIPGVDPAKDIDITVHDGLLTIKAVRNPAVEYDGPNSVTGRSRGPFRRPREPTSATSVSPVKRHPCHLGAGARRCAGGQANRGRSTGVIPRRRRHSCVHRWRAFVRTPSCPVAAGDPGRVLTESGSNSEPSLRR
jgi:Hsp20/alpha crystallin family protein